MLNSSQADPVTELVMNEIETNFKAATQNYKWLTREMHPYFFLNMQNEKDALAHLASSISNIQRSQKCILVDTDEKLISACLSLPGTLYETLKSIPERDISYTHISQSYSPLPGLSECLEVQQFEFDRKCSADISGALIQKVKLPEDVKVGVSAILGRHYPDFNFNDFDRLLSILWTNNEAYVWNSPPERIAQILWLYQQGTQHGGVYLDAQSIDGPDGKKETRILFAVGNPPQKDFLLQIMEVFKRLGITVKRTYCLTLNNGIHPYFLGTFYVRTEDEGLVERNSVLFERLKNELYNTQVLQTASLAYKDLTTNSVLSGEEAALVNAFISFCHTNLAHHQANEFGFDFEGVERAFIYHPDIALQLIELFKVRFDPNLTNREQVFTATLERTQRAIDSFNTGRKSLDEFRSMIFRCCLIFIRHTLKTNFFVPEKHALAFRMDPLYLEKLGAEFVSDLPADRPFRITFFFGRYGSGYHIGFSDIARGGWRTIITKGRDDYVVNANTLFRECYVLAHTQHLKNKDIYQGGSKMVAILNATTVEDSDLVTQRLYKLQYGFINAFFDIFVTEAGTVMNPRVVDYYREDEPIELGPDENMHDQMIELIARLAVEKKYLLGAGVMSGKKVGINHKEYGVTSVGVVKFSEIAMEQVGIDIQKDAFSVKFTGGPNGDVAGNAMRLLLNRCPQVEIRLILDGSGALFDPLGADREELGTILLKSDVDSFNPAMLSVGGFILYRSQRKKEGLRELFKKTTRTENGLKTEWISIDEFSREYGALPFSVTADLFIPAGGRPETINGSNWAKFFDSEGNPSSQTIVEGANSFLTPSARQSLQEKGVVILRDAAANKCGVISSSYEIIANLLLSDEEFIVCKEKYVADVIDILEKRASDEARLIFRRKQEQTEAPHTEISDSISREINAHYAKLYDFFQARPGICDEPEFMAAMLSHLPQFLCDQFPVCERLARLLPKYRYAILASEIASSLVYGGNQELAFEEMVRGHIQSRYNKRIIAA